MRPLLGLLALTVALYAYSHQTKRTTESDALAALQRDLERATTADEFSGTVVIAKCGVPIFERAYALVTRPSESAVRAV